MRKQGMDRAGSFAKWSAEQSERMAESAPQSWYPHSRSEGKV